MKTPLITALCASLALGACATISNSRINPFNWFGGSEEVAMVSPDGKPADTRQLVSQVTVLVLEKMPGGVIVRATGLPPVQGFWDAELVARPVEDGKLTYDFRVFPPIIATNVSTPRSREVTVATYISDIKLAGVREITVQGAANARASRR
ncbi:hypothetical protein SAMN05216227_100670 [Pseudorhodobacter antarcticus]|uniref:Lipoprotein n=1 Tax=Pseudorhodobacter antarcticus TaxID=1077947 RepID=A0A1H8D4H0_9RHOB|nr:hypothetical protein [Pseudorhodobacter antarcticus]SEN02099.1 hypothetical protein SAMN05216227_100670 [Pseudorhodobacter antarcticus]